MLGPSRSQEHTHKPGMARWLNDWAAGFAARTPNCLHTATFFAEPSALDDLRRALGQGARVFKCHLQVGGYDPNDPLLRDVWGLLADTGVPVVTHCGSSPVPGAFTGPGPIDFPNIPHTYGHALRALEETGLGTTWLRAVCHDNAARLFGMPAAARPDDR